MPLHSRNKGANGEREVRDVLRRHGFSADRDGRLDWDLRHDVPGVHLEVKRRETLAIPAWTRQAEEDAARHDPPVEACVVFRQSHQPWRACVNFEWLLALIAENRELKGG
jgi:hypothetical protein